MAVERMRRKPKTGRNVARQERKEADQRRRKSRRAKAHRQEEEIAYVKP